jgi:hypothetical protein
MPGLGLPSLYANVGNFDDIGTGLAGGGGGQVRMSAYRRRRKTKRRMKGSGKRGKRGRTKKCKCGPKCKSCGKYNCKKGKSCRCPPGCGKRRTRGGSSGGGGSDDLEFLSGVAGANPGAVSMSDGKYTLKWPATAEGNFAKWNFSGNLIVAKAATAKSVGDLYGEFALV